MCSGRYAPFCNFCRCSSGINRITSPFYYLYEFKGKRIANFTSVDFSTIGSLWEKKLSRGKKQNIWNTASKQIEEIPLVKTIWFKYLRSCISHDGNFVLDVRARINTMRLLYWRQWTGVMWIHTEFQQTSRKHKQLLSTMEMRLLRWMNGLSLREPVRNTHNRKLLVSLQSRRICEKHDYFKKIVSNLSLFKISWISSENL